jgi:hypothetical protein
VRVHVDFLVDVPQDALLVDDERDALREASVRGQDAVLLRGAAVRIAEQLEVQGLSLGELLQVRDVVEAEAVDLDVELFQDLPCVPQGANLERSPGRGCFREEGEHGPGRLFLPGGDRDHLAQVVVQAEGGRGLAYLGQCRLLGRILMRHQRRERESECHQLGFHLVSPQPEVNVSERLYDVNGMSVLPSLATLTSSLLLAFIGPRSEDALSAWFAEEEGKYVSTPVLDGRIHVVHASRRSSGALKKGVQKTCRAFDRILPPDADMDAPVPILVQLEDPAALGRLKTFLGREHPYLAGWAESGERGVGFVLEEPLIAGWLREVPGVKKSEWKPQNELTNRLVQALLIQRAGRLPQWLTQGLAWYVELEVKKSIYCFPFRAGFVGKKEHKGWQSALKAMLVESGQRAPTMTELAGWPRGSYDDRHAALAWGAATLLARYFPEELPLVVADFEERTRTGGRITNADGSWESVPDYEIPPDEQLAILDERLGTSFLGELERFCRQGRSYVRPR